MLLAPQSTAAQQSVLQDRRRIAAQYPVCELWVLLQAEIARHFVGLSAESLSRVSAVSGATAKVLRWISGQGVQSVLAWAYIMTLERSAHETATAARLASLGSVGAGSVTLDAGAVEALALLSAWDDVLGSYQPNSPANAGERLLLGVTMGVGS